MLLGEIDFALGDAIITVLVIFLWVIYFWILIMIFSDLFSDHETSGWAKAGWVVLCLLFWWLGPLIYLIVRGQGMAKRRMAAAQEAQQQFDAYVRQTAGAGGGGGGGGGDATAQIERAHNLLEKGAISQDEFDEIKRKALS